MVLYKVRANFEFVDEIQKCDHSNDTEMKATEQYAV